MSTKVLLITGGHPFERDPFLALWRALEGITFQEIQYPAAESFFAPERFAECDAIAFYDFGQTMSEHARRDFMKLLQRGKGMVFLHHALHGHSEWPDYLRVVGGAWIDRPRQIDGRQYAPSQYAPNQHVPVHVADPHHPVTAGLLDFELTEETYQSLYIAPGVTPLLTTTHPKSEPLLGWTHQYERSRIVYLQPGHGSTTFNDLNYRRLLRQAIQWVAAPER